MDNTIVMNTAQITIVGVVTIVLAWLAGLIVEKFVPWFLAWSKIKPGVSIDLGRTVKTVLVVVAAGLLSWWWYPASLPTPPFYAGTFLEKTGQFFDYLPVFVTALLPYVGAASVLYNILLTYMLDPDKRKRLLLDLNKLLAQWRDEPKPPA